MLRWQFSFERHPSRRRRVRDGLALTLDIPEDSFDLAIYVETASGA
jgi:hypothetical protein